MPYIIKTHTPIEKLMIPTTRLKYKITSAASDAQGFKKFLNELLKEYIDKYKPEETQLSDSFMIKQNKHKQNKKKEKEDGKCC